MITTLPSAPHPIDKDSFVIPTFAAAPGGGWVGSHSLVVRGAQPTIVDTGSSLVRESWFEHVSSVVDLDDVRWVFVSHDDHDHVGNLLEVLDRCPNATLVASFLVVGRLSGDLELPIASHALDERRRHARCGRPHVPRRPSRRCSTRLPHADCSTRPAGCCGPPTRSAA